MKLITNAYNNNPDIVGYEIPVHTQEWFQFRTVGIPEYSGGFGASEISVICGKSSPKYGKIIPVLLEEKAGIREIQRDMNEHMLSGILAEDIILERWKYYDGTDKGYITNWMNQRIIRKSRKLNCYLVNNKYPWLFASLDSSILAKQHGLMRPGQLLNEEHPLECKQLSYFAAQTWANKVPPQYIYQINQQMLVCGVEYAELAVLQDGYNFQVYPFELDMSICEEILEKSYKAWNDVLKMRELHLQQKHALDIGNFLQADKIKAELESFIPEPDSSEGWKEFMNDRFIVEKESFEGTTKDFRKAVNRQRAKYAIQLLEQYVDAIDNQLRAEFVKNASETMEFNGAGKITYKKVGSRKDPQFNYAGLKRVKEAYDQDYVEEIINPLINK